LEITTQTEEISILAHVWYEEFQPGARAVLGDGSAWKALTRDDQLRSSGSRRVYTHIVSLGNGCRPSYQIARHFQFKQSFPFDEWGTPLDSAARFIEVLDCDLYQAEDLQVRETNSGISTVLNSRFQISLYHDFKRESFDSGDRVRPEWRSGIDRARKRTRYRVKNLQSLNTKSNRVLFVRWGDEISQLASDRWLTPQEATERLVIALRTRFDRISFDLMCIDFQHRLDGPDPRIIYVDICDPPAPATRWEGTDHLWSQAFDQIGAQIQTATRMIVAKPLLRYLEKAGLDDSLYLKMYPDVRTAVEEGTLNSGLEHFVAFGLTEGRTFHFTAARWPEERYLRENPDVGAAVAAGQFISGLEHFVRFGRLEGVGRPFVESILSDTEG
jgi:hypothetical protein